MKNLTETINESLLFEGFLDKLKDGIDKLTNNPKPYLEKFRKELENDKKLKEIKRMEVNDPKGFAAALDDLNDDEKLKTIYKWMVKLLKNNDSLTNVLLKYNDKEFSTGYEELEKAIISQFKLDKEKDKNKILAIMNIVLTMAQFYAQNHKQKEEKPFKAHSYSSGSGSGDFDYVSSAIAIAMA